MKINNITDGSWKSAISQIVCLLASLWGAITIASILMIFVDINIYVKRIIAKFADLFLVYPDLIAGRGSKKDL